MFSEEYETSLSLQGMRWRCNIGGVAGKMLVRSRDPALTSQRTSTCTAIHVKVTVLR